MAKRNPSASIGDAKGKIGHLVRYQRNGKQLIRKAPTREKSRRPGGAGERHGGLTASALAGPSGPGRKHY